MRTNIVNHEKIILIDESSSDELIDYIIVFFMYKSSMV